MKGILVSGYDLILWEADMGYQGVSSLLSRPINSLGRHYINDLRSNPSEALFPQQSGRV